MHYDVRINNERVQRASGEDLRGRASPSSKRVAWPLARKQFLGLCAEPAPCLVCFLTRSKFGAIRIFQQIVDQGL